MMEKLGSVLCLLVLCSGFLAENIKASNEELLFRNENCKNVDHELLTTKLEILEQQIAEQQLEMRKQNELIQSVHDSLKKIVENKFSVHESRINQHNSELNQTLDSFQKKAEINYLNLESLFHQQNGDLKQTLDSLMEKFEGKFLTQESKINQQNDELKQNIDKLQNADKEVLATLSSMKLTVDQKFNEVFDYFKTIKNRIIRSCTEEPTKVTGQYLLQPFANETSFMGYCKQDSFGGGWLVFQQRFEGYENFYRNWTEYRNGFGQIDGEFWLGLERLHRLTKGKKHSLLVELEAYDGDYGYALYGGFEIGSEEEKYALKVLGSYNGTAGDSLTDHHKGQKFSTYDNDNDGYPDSNCAAEFKGAWWYSKCHASHLNGQYKNENHGGTNCWVSFKGRNGLKLTRMMIREN